jgi:hypothetical protein
MGRPRSRPGNPSSRTTDRLLEAAEREFGRKGFEGTRLEDIALIEGKGIGSRILLREILVLLRRVESFVRKDGRGVVREDLPVRQAILMFVASGLVSSAAGPLRKLVWGRTDQGQSLVRNLFLGRA